jgi:hypothetical protein
VTKRPEFNCHYGNLLRTILPEDTSQYSGTTRVCLAGSYTATFFATIAAISDERYDGKILPKNTHEYLRIKKKLQKNARFILSSRRISPQSPPGTSASSARRTKSRLCRTYVRMRRIYCSVSCARVFGFGCSLSCGCENVQCLNGRGEYLNNGGLTVTGILVSG